MYGCNERFGMGECRVSEEAEMQGVALEGLRSVSGEVYDLAVRVIGDENVSPLVCHCAYLAASEMAWFLREEGGGSGSGEGREGLRVVVALLKRVGERWGVAGEFWTWRVWGEAGAMC